MARGVILDRDGTLIDVVRDAELGVVVTAFHPDQIRILPGVVEGLRALAQAGYTLAVATNQPGAAKGQIPRSAIERTNAALIDRLSEQGVAIAALEVCLHHPSGGPGGDPALVGPCACRKPKPGMLLALASRLGLDAAESYMIGDSASDLEAARAAGMRAGLVYDGARVELCPMGHESPAGAANRPDVVAPRIDELAREILARRAK